MDLSNRQHIGASPELGGSFPILVMRQVDKVFGTTKALQQVDFVVHSSEVVALMGGNGAGKSTLMKIVGGLVIPDKGEISLLGRRVDAHHSPHAAMVAGLRFVHQELSLCSNLRIFENFAIELPDVIRGVGWKRIAIKLSKAALDEIFPDNDIDPHSKISELSLSQQQMVEIARAATHPATKLLILDEPTSSLASREASQLRTYIKRRRTDGISFIFISHRLQESLELADRIVVMRNGSIAWSGDASGISHGGLLQLLSGKNAEVPTPLLVGDVAKEEVIRVSSLSEGILNKISFTAGRGEIVGLAGLEGSGQRQLLYSIFQGSQAPGGTLTVNGRVAFVSGDRASEGVFSLWSINDNIGLSSLWGLTRWGLISPQRLSALTASWFGKLKIQASSGDAPIVSLSGGNQQKAVIARALAANADVILLDDPTRGVDLGTKADLYQLFRELAAQGRTIIWYSTDDKEFAQCDRTLVMRNGSMVAEFRRQEVSEQRLIDASFRSVDHEDQVAAYASSMKLARRWETFVSAAIPLATFVLIFAVCIFFNPRIFSQFGLTLMFASAFGLAFAAISQLFIIAAGDIDLGLGNYIGLVNVVAATWLIIDPWLAALCFFGMLAAYPIMGLFIEARRVPAIIVTLGLSFVWVGLAAIRLPRAGGSSPEWLVELLRIKLPFVPLPVLLCFIPALIAYLVLMVWRYGAVLRGYGANPRAIEAAGWSTRTAKASLYAFAGLFAFLAGILVTGSTRGGDPTGSASMTLLSVAAGILGGAAFSGGIVSPFGAVFGTLTLVLVGTLLAQIGVGSVFLPMVQGLLLLGVIGLRTLLTGITSR